MASKETEWDLTPLLSGDNDSSAAKKLEKVRQENYKFISKWKLRTDYLDSPRVLREALDEYEKLIRAYGFSGDPGYYFTLRNLQDQSNPALKAKISKLQEFSKKIENDSMFFALRIAKIPEQKQKKFLSSPELQKYKHYLETLFAEAKYLLTEPEEKILILKETPSYANWVNMTEDFLSREERVVLLEDGKKAKKNISELTNLISSKSKKVRDIAAKAFNDILAKHVDTAEVEINSILLNKRIDDELRKLPRPDLARHIGDDIESEVVDVLIKAVASRFDLSKRFYKLKARILGLKKLKYHERNIEYGKLDKKYTYEDTLTLIKTVIGNLDSEFLKIFESFQKNRQIDVYPKKGKRSGASCWHSLPVHPTYILLNHTDRIDNVLTLAHELGHGINNELIKKKQHALDFDTPLSTAEVASTFVEDFVLQELLKEADDELKLAIIVHKLNTDITTIFRQVACYQFEQELHKEFREKGYLSKEEIGKLFQKHMASYLGPIVELSPGSENWWVYWIHIRDFFYVYSYASGLLISKFLQRVAKKDHRFIENVKEFLAAGTSESPKNIFKKLGIDITHKPFWDKGLDEIEELLNETEKLAKRLGKL